MCSCREIRLEDVAYRLGSGNRLIPYHKDCGDELSAEQVDEIDRIRLKKWGLV